MNLLTLDFLFLGVQSKDSLVLWQHGSFRGTHRTLLSGDNNLHVHSFGDTVSSIEVMGTYYFLLNSTFILKDI